MRSMADASERPKRRPRANEHHVVEGDDSGHADITPANPLLLAPEGSQSLLDPVPGIDLPPLWQP